MHHDSYSTTIMSFIMHFNSKRGKCEEGEEERTYHECILLCMCLEPSVAKLGRSINKFELDLFKSRPLGMSQQGLEKNMSKKMEPT